MGLGKRLWESSPCNRQLQAPNLEGRKKLGHRRARRRGGKPDQEPEQRHQQDEAGGAGSTERHGMLDVARRLMRSH